ncbi:MAG TPA: DNA topoisomerase IV subunit A [Bacilli bacterium]|nr:DNA topoisomerase IV subunit A [Bacilli bacterium]
MNSNDKNKKSIKKIEEFVSQRIIQENLEEIVGERFARYSRYIIQDRALPDARDGLKPVQRRILYAMYRLGMFSNRPYRKSARIVGEVIGKYHPHGDSSVYDALVRMAQDFKMRLPLIDMHGNSGSIDGDPPAAMRYTEARLSKYAEFLLQDINKKTVGFVPNFDDEELEPTVLPAKFPNLLVNGATGISAGYATEIPPHNIDEIINAVIYRINNPNCTLEEIMEIVKGPDFPTGGIIQGVDGIREAYETGRGKIIISSKIEFEETKSKKQLIITEIPFDTNKSVLIRRMNDVCTSRGIDGINEIRDESDREGLRIVVELRKDANHEYIRNFLLKYGGLQATYNFNMVCIANKKPVLMGLLDILDTYINHQKEVITNRSNFELKSAERRLHIVEGLIAMTSILDAVIATIRNSKNKKDAIENLISKYDFTPIQAEAIVMLQLYRLTNTDILELQDEHQKLKDLVENLKQILSDEKVLLKTIKNELRATLKEVSTPRKSVIEAEVEDLKIEVEELIAKEDVVVIVTNDGYIKRLSMRAHNSLAENETTKLKEDDFVVGEFNITTVDTLLMFTNLGNYIYLPVHKIPECRHRDLGYNVSTLVSIEINEKVIYTVPISNFEEERYLLFTTRNGLTKRTLLKDMVATRYSKALRATKIREDDELVSVDITKPGDPNPDVVVITRQGYISRYESNEISVMAPASFGVKAIENRSRPDDTVVGAHFMNNKDTLVILTDNYNIKRFKIEELTKGKRNHVGKIYINLPKSYDAGVVSSNIINHQNANDDLGIYIIGSEGFKRIEYNEIRLATAASGRKLSLKEIGKPEKIIFARNMNDFN